MESFLQFVESQGDENGLLHAIVQQPDDQVSYFALADWLEEHGLDQVGQVFRQIGENAGDAVTRMNIAWYNLENQELKKYCQGKFGLWHVVFPYLTASLSGESVFVSLLKSQGMNVTFLRQSDLRIRAEGEYKGHNFKFGYESRYQRVFVNELDGQSPFLQYTQNFFNYNLVAEIEATINNIVKHYVELSKYPE